MTTASKRELRYDESCVRLVAYVWGQAVRVWWAKGNAGPACGAGPVGLGVPLFVQHAAGDRNAAAVARAVATQLRAKGYRAKTQRGTCRGPAADQPLKPRWYARDGRELPLDPDGRPLCPKCTEYSSVQLGKLGAYCTFCRDYVDRVEPRRHWPDF